MSAPVAGLRGCGTCKRERSLQGIRKGQGQRQREGQEGCEDPIVHPRQKSQTCQSEGKQSLESYKQPPKKRAKAKKGEQLPEPAAAPKAAPARLEISAVVPLNTHDRRWDQLATIKGKSTGSLAF